MRDLESNQKLNLSILHMRNKNPATSQSIPLITEAEQDENVQITGSPVRVVLSKQPPPSQQNYRSVDPIVR